MNGTRKQLYVRTDQGQNQYYLSGNFLGDMLRWVARCRSAKTPTRQKPKGGHPRTVIIV
jgi:hypothetical protein